MSHGIYDEIDISRDSRLLYGSQTSVDTFEHTTV